MEERRGKNLPSAKNCCPANKENEFPAGKQQNFPKATFARSSWPPPFHLHFILLELGHPAPEKPEEGCALLAEPALPAASRGPEQVRSEGKVAPEQRLL